MKTHKYITVFKVWKIGFNLNNEIEKINPEERF